MCEIETTDTEGVQDEKATAQVHVELRFKVLSWQLPECFAQRQYLARNENTTHSVYTISAATRKQSSQSKQTINPSLKQPHLKEQDKKLQKELPH